MGTHTVQTIPRHVWMSHWQHCKTLETVHFELVIYFELQLCCFTVTETKNKQVKNRKSSFSLTFESHSRSYWCLIGISQRMLINNLRYTRVRKDYISFNKMRRLYVKLISICSNHDTRWLVLIVQILTFTKVHFFSHISVLSHSNKLLKIKLKESVTFYQH